MNDLQRLLAELYDLDITCRLLDGKLRLNGPKEALTPDLLARIKGLKPQLLSFLGQEEVVADPESDPVPAKPARPAAPPAPAALSHRPEPMPLSFAQSRLWFLDRLDPGNPFYNVPIVMRMRGRMERSLLQKALDRIVVRHESLRTFFPFHDGEPCQRLTPEIRFPLIEEDLSHLPSEAREAALESILLQGVAFRFDLAERPPIHAVLVRLAADDHVMLANLHHIITDGWSMGVMVRELCHFYGHYALGMPDILPKPPIQYADYTIWQRSWLDETRMEEQLGYWRHKFEGVPTLLELPTDKPRPMRQSFNGGRLVFYLERPLVARLEALAQSWGATLFMALQAGFAALLTRITSQDDVVIGFPIANRNHKGIEELIGFFVNTLALRIQPSLARNFRELTLQVRQSSLEAFDHQDVPFERIVEAIGLERDLSHSPLFQVMLALQNAPLEDLELQGLSLEFPEVPGDTSRFDLMISLRQIAEGIRGDVEFNADIFEEATVSRILRHFTYILTSLSAAPEQSWRLAELMSSRERRRLLDHFNDTKVASHPANAVLLLERCAARSPEARALVWGDRVWSYAQLNEEANRLAHHLIHLGIGPGAHVGLCRHRNLDMVSGMLAVLKAGAAVVPLDLSHPQARLLQMIEDGRLSLILSGTAERDLLPDHKVPVVFLDQGGWDDASPRNPNRIYDDGLPIYLLYTSGTTGKPKGILLPHRAWAHLLDWFCKTLPEPYDTLQFASIGFDMSFYEMFTTFAQGGALHLIPDELRKDAAGLATRVHKAGIQRVMLPVSLLQVWSEIYVRQPRLFQDLRQVITAGEALAITPGLVRMFKDLDCQLHNHYGPAETHALTAFQLPGPPDTWPANAPIGHAVSGNHIYLLDPLLRPVPFGVPGLLYAHGPQQALGYLGRPALTAERFVPDPFSGIPGARLYNTGDRIRYVGREDGSAPPLVFMGRLDQQLKIRGFRVEPADIAQVMREHPQISDAYVLAFDREGHKHLAGYAVAGEGVDVPALRDWLRERLPSYMVPASLCLLARFPLNTNGKVDVRALPAPVMESGEVRVAPRNPSESRIAEVWCELLKLESLSVEENFFDLGGHSLLANRVVVHLQQKFGYDLGVADLFEHPTVARLAAFLEQSDAALDQMPALLPQHLSGPSPLSFAQQRLWLLEQMEDTGSAYHLVIPFQLLGPLDVGALDRAALSIIERHESLRTVFVEVDGNPLQSVMPAPDHGLSVIDLSGLNGDSRDAALAALTDLQVDAPYDLAHGPVIRINAMRLAPCHHALVAGMHHIVSDGWSTSVFSNELSLLYNALVSGASLPLAPLPIQYRDYAVLQRQWLDAENIADMTRFWKVHLADVPAETVLPFDHPRPAVQSYNGGAFIFPFSDKLHRQVQAYALERGVTPFMVLFSVYAVLLCWYGNREDVAIGMPTANRTRSEIEGLIGFFVNMLVLHANLRDNPSFDELCARTRQLSLGAFAHGELPFEQLVEALKVPRNPGLPPLFQAMFILQNTPPQELSLLGLELRDLPCNGSGSKVDLTLSLTMLDEGFSGLIEFNRDLFEPSTIRHIAGHYCQLLQLLLEDPSVSIWRHLPLVDEEHRILLSEWAGDSISQSLGDSPLAFLAAASEDGALLQLSRNRKVSVSYASLRSRVEARAGAFAKMGIGQGSFVGVHLMRSVDWVECVLGLWRLGAVYVPLDPMYPPGRLAPMMAGLDAVVTTTAMRSGLGEHRLPMLLVDRAVRPASFVEPLLHGHDPMYVLHTSGSTGKPKGVVIPRRGFVSMARHLPERFDLGRGDRLLQFASMGFDVSIMELVMSLSAGATLVLCEREPLLNPEGLCRFLAEQEITHFCLPPIVLAGVSKVPPLPKLRVVAVAGERCGASIVHAWAPGRRFINAYGPTETTVLASAADLTADIERDPSIGRPLADSTAYVLDRKLRPLPVNVPGKLYLGGRRLASFYRGLPARTASVFVPNPFNADAGDVDASRLYDSGDLVRWSPSGEIEFLGRADRQLKLRGFRIEPADIEHALCAWPAISRAVVGLRELGAATQLLAWVACDNLDEPALRAHLVEALPDYMVPAHVVAMAALPQTPNGKIDEKALPLPLFDASVEGRDPATPEEQRVAAIWREVLDLDIADVHANFFDLGGHSLLANRVIVRLREFYDMSLSVADLFRHPTIAELARLLEGAERTAVRMPPIQPVDSEGPYPLSFSQLRLWLLDQLENTGPAYHLFFAMSLSGPLDVKAMDRAVRAIIARHEALRTVFSVVDGQPVQRILPVPSYGLPLLDLALLPKGVAESTRVGVVRAIADDPFDLSQGPLLRMLLIRSEPNRHTLALNMHHIISDGWSLGVFTNELVALYAAELEGRPSPLPALPVQYRDYAFHQRQWLDDANGDRLLRFWREALHDLPDRSLLPTDHRRPAQQSYNGTTLSFPLDESTVQRLLSVAREVEATPFMALLSVFGCLLFHHGAGSDLAVGTPVANRSHNEIEPLIGFFVNTLVLRLDLSGSPGFRELLERVKSMALAAFAHEELPFERLVEELRPVRHLDTPPLFQLMFILQNAAQPEFAFPGLVVDSEPFSGNGAKLDLTISMIPDGRSFLAVVEFNRDLFEQATIERVFGHFLRLIELLGNDPLSPIHHLSPMSEEECSRLLATWAATEGDIPLPFPDRVFDVSPDLLAVRHVRGTQVEALSYGALASEVATRRGLLCAKGAGVGVMVGVHLERGSDWLCWTLAIWSCGAIYVPLDTLYPRERLAHMVDGLQLIVCDIATQPDLPSCDAVLIDRLERGEAIEPLSPDPDMCAYVLYTSGSTGKPKGVCVPHAALASLAHHLPPRLELTAGDRFLQFASIGFDVSVGELAAATAVGATLVMTDREALLAPGRLKAFLVEEEISHFCLPPVVLRGCDGAGLPLLKVAAIAGERCPEEVARAWAEHVRFIDAYGPTETTVLITAADVPADFRDDPPIGRALPNCSVFVMNPRLEPTLQGVPGKLFLGGAHLASGYLDDPVRTALAFVPHPFGNAGERLYDSGDLARFDNEGLLHFLGRADDQVKIRGFRIEPADIERALSSLGGVRSAAVVAQSAPEGARLAAFVCGDGLTAPRLREQLALLLPAYMIPSTFTIRDQLPLSASGKVDRKRLRSELGGPTLDQAQAPNTPSEHLLLPIWREQLGLPELGINHNFFAAGGHSLVAARTVAQCNAQLGLRLSIHQLFQHPSVAMLANFIDHSPELDEVPPLVPIDYEPGQALPTLPLQDMVLDHERDRVGDSTFHMPLDAHFGGFPDVLAFEHAFNRVIERHEILRSTFREVEGCWQMFVEEMVPVSLPLIDLSGLPAELASAEGRRLVAMSDLLGFDMAHDHMLRPFLLRLAADDHMLALNLQHIAGDGWSLHSLIDEISHFYQQGLGLAGELPAPTIQYKDYAVWESKRLRSPAHERRVAWWHKFLNEHHRATILTADFPRPEHSRYKGGRVMRRLDQELVTAIESHSAAWGVTSFATMLATYKLLLHQLTGESKVVVGVPAANRDHEAVQDLVGLLLDILVYVTDMRDLPDFPSLVKRVHEVNREAWAHKGVPLKQLAQNLSGPTHKLAFNMVSVDIPMPRLPGLSLKDLDIDQVQNKTDITFYIHPDPPPVGWSLRMVYDADLFTHDRIERLMDQYIALLTKLLSA